MPDDVTGAFLSRQLGVRQAAPPMGAGAQTAVVLSATATRATVALDIDRTQAFTGCPFSPVYTATAGPLVPPAGTACLVMFATTPRGRQPWIVAFDTWPT